MEIDKGKEKLSKLFSAFTKAQARFELTDARLKIIRLLRRLYVKWLLRRCCWAFERYLEKNGEATPLVLIIGARISFHKRLYLRALSYVREILSRDIGADQRALALMIRAECHEMIGNLEKPEDTFKFIFDELDHKLEPINQIRILRSRAGFEGRRENIEKARRDIERARKIAVERGFADELLKLKAL